RRALHDHRRVRRPARLPHAADQPLPAVPVLVESDHRGSSPGRSPARRPTLWRPCCTSPARRRPAGPARLGVGGQGMSWRHVAHTADVGIEVEARTREELFAEAAEALTALLVAAPDDEGDADADADDGAATEADAAAATAAGGAVGDAGSATAAGGAAGDADAVAPVEVPVRVPPGDDAAMLRDWLAEVLVAFEVDGVVGREFPVAIGPDGLT